MDKSRSPLLIPVMIWTLLAIDSSFMLLPLKEMLLFHSLLSLLLIGLFILSAKQKRDLRFLLPFTLFLIFLGPPGGAIFAFSSCLNFFSKRCSEPLSALMNSLFLDIQEENSEMIYDRIIYHLDNLEPHRIPMPFSDIMMFGTYNQKRMAIEKMLRYFTPEFSKPLKMGLSDPSAAIKVQTACALSSIDQSLFERYTTLKKQWKENINKIMPLKAFASFGTYYALSGILESDRLNMILEECIPALIKLLKRRPADAEAKIELAKLYLLNGQNQKVKEILEPFLQERHHQKGSEILMEALFNLKEYDAISLLASTTHAQMIGNPDRKFVSPAIELWSGESCAAS